MKTIFLPIVLGLILAVNHATAKNIQSRVVGGRDTTIEQHPYQLSLEYHNEHYAGAVLIRRNIALTGAHAFLKYEILISRTRKSYHSLSAFSVMTRGTSGTSTESEQGRVSEIKVVNWPGSTMSVFIRSGMYKKKRLQAQEQE